jgi:hypothetical protein
MLTGTPHRNGGSGRYGVGGVFLPGGHAGKLGGNPPHANPRRILLDQSDFCTASAGGALTLKASAGPGRLTR